MKSAKTRKTLQERRKTNSERNAVGRNRRSNGKDQGIRKDQRGQEQPADKRRAQQNC